MTTDDVGLFQLVGDFWIVTFRGATLHIRDSKGMHYLAQLLEHPGRPVDVRQLAADADARAAARRRRQPGPHASRRNSERDRTAVGKRIRSALAHLQRHHAGLGHYLRTTISTGYQCVFVPDPAHPGHWRVRR